MVHRIQNRNPGYSDFSNIGSAQSFNFSQSMSTPVTQGANALKLENEITSDSVINTQETDLKNIVENNSIDNYEQSFSDEVLSEINNSDENISEESEHSTNGLENFGVEEETPDLFSTENEHSEAQDLLSSDNSENDPEDDDLEIPAFLRRQKN